LRNKGNSYQSFYKNGKFDDTEMEIKAINAKVRAFSTQIVSNILTDAPVTKSEFPGETNHNSAAVKRVVRTANPFNQRALVTRLDNRRDFVLETESATNYRFSSLHKISTPRAKQISPSFRVEDRCLGFA